MQRSRMRKCGGRMGLAAPKGSPSSVVALRARVAELAKSLAAPAGPPKTAREVDASGRAPQVHSAPSMLAGLFGCVRDRKTMRARVGGGDAADDAEAPVLGTRGPPKVQIEGDASDPASDWQ